ncbi:uncharacterized protein LOC107668723 [Sinocyclocheilus anshuiensis]|uniref:uncharacterized protein LOC107668723 n=1 Tax=Sinocyclocheilus anshuiensis TaxID=1608454 RepID=UPI0007BA9B8B|nr:PREDICTED: uncharacterized protein LOC107668723 [Sinocyclocheilus anshuiensis]
MAKWYHMVVFSPVVSVWSVPHIHSTTTTAFACIFQCFFCQQVQQSCNSSSASPEEPSEEHHDCEMVKMTKSKTFQAYLPNCHRTYSCIHCRAHLANHDELISKVVFSPVVSVWSVPHIHSTTTTAFACIFQCFFCQQVQQSCNSSSASPEEPSEEHHDCEMVKMTKSKTFQAYLPNCHRTYSCIHCRAHLANHDELISKGTGGTCHSPRWLSC